MNIVVCVKHVPDATAERAFRDSDRTVDRTGVAGLLSELDEYAVEQALQVVADAGGEVTVLTVGPEQAGDAVRKALQMGADKGVHVSDEAIHGSDAPATSLILATAIQKLGDVDVVLCGMASTDGTMGLVPAMLAERLGWPQVTYVVDVEVDGQKVRARRDSDLAAETIEASTPLVLSVTDQANEPRYPSFKGIMAAKKKPVQTWSLADLGIPADQVGLTGAWTAVDSFTARPPRSAGTVVTDEGDGARRLVEFLAGQKFV
ncbi:MAG: electron transfer flavoprotein subunit beta/FixA family protein [Actinomycetota bacterium]|nr:electron transfer flavoprotein subunit beta/FixA family protein [Actinomycetota bacterium]